MSLPFDPSEFSATVLQPNNINAIFGVPDSSLSGLLSFFASTMSPRRHIVTANEGGAIALAVGYYLATKKVALCYMQNSGLSNALSPLQSLASNAVAAVPVLLMIGWRGKPGIKDEPQHALIGPRLLENLEANKIPYEEIPEKLDEVQTVISKLIAKALAENTPVALVVPPNTFTPYKGCETEQSERRLACLTLYDHTNVSKGATTWLTKYPDQPLPLTREMVVRSVLEQRQSKDIVISALGGTSREVYMVLREKEQPISRIFFVLGAMGHSYGVANGVRLGQSPEQAPIVYCIEGDGSFLMHAGNTAVLADVGPRGLVHVVVYNGVHSSTGNQPLSIGLMGFLNLAKGLNYNHTFLVDSAQALDQALGLAAAAATKRPLNGESVGSGEASGANILIVVLVGPGQSASLPRPVETAEHLKNLFMQSLGH
ncbi:thiamine pyrophosphate enzyme, N-terminal TPP binding domain-containing protein [Xylariaceae sp. FL0255]|nr:thiamine pyrophosphate enzyme, N-terminal TPP binding domain-containing protein [Xylariaceae sp. FL0255]